jgi:hypothetical protein
MVFRTETRISAILVIAAGMAGAQSIDVRHQHLRHDGPGKLSVTAEGISFTESGKHAEHSRVWKYEQIQQLELSPGGLRVLTYEDQKWLLGRDREYLFIHLPEGFAKSVYPMWRDKLDQRFIAALADDEVTTLAEFPAKLTGTLKGVEGTLLFGEDRILFRASKAGESRTWRFADIQNIASAGPFDFSIVTLEHHGAWKAGGREFRFQLQRGMEEARFNDLWRRVVGRSLTGLMNNR